MSFTVEPVTNVQPTTGYSTPDRASFCVTDSGAGGQILVNGLGVTSGVVGTAVDLATLFGTAFRSIPLLRAFKAATTAQKACDQFNTYLNIAWILIGNAVVAGTPQFAYALGGGGGPTDVPYLSISGPSIASTWRIDLSLRHSIPG